LEGRVVSQEDGKMSGAERETRGRPEKGLGPMLEPWDERAKRGSALAGRARDASSEVPNRGAGRERKPRRPKGARTGGGRPREKDPNTVNKKMNNAVTFHGRSLSAARRCAPGGRNKVTRR